METNPKQFTISGTSKERLSKEKEVPVFKVDDLGIKRRAPKLSREDEAKQMLEHTAVSPGVARGLCVFFLLTIFSVPVLQFVAKVRKSEPFLPDLSRSQSVLPQEDELKQFESDLESQSVVGRRVMPQAQNLLTHLGVGNENAYVGRNGWLVYRPDLNYVTGHGFLDPHQMHRRSLATEADGTPIQPDPIKAIIAFKEQLAQRGIKLILLPTPLKPMVEPQHFVAGSLSFSAPLQNPSYQEFLRQMKQNDVTVCDPTNDLFQAQRKGEAQYLRTDTHWTPAGLRTTANVLANVIEAEAKLPKQKATYTVRPTSIAGNGDVGAMLKLPPSDAQSMFPPQKVALDRIVDDKGEDWRPSPRADVLLLGDSFTNIYSMRGMGWGRSAGLAEQLSFRLQRPLDVIAINAGGSHATRRRLRDELWRNANRLQNTKVVVWQFAMRDLQSGDWQKIDLPQGPSQSAPVEATNSSKLNTAVEAAIRPLNPATLAKFRRAVIWKADHTKSDDKRVVGGSAGWMFFRTDVDYVAGPDFLARGKNPQVDALVDFKRQLDQRGIRLIVMPAPSKATIYPEKLGINGVDVPQTLQNPSFMPFRKALEAQGIEVYDPTGTLLRQKRSTRAPLYMPTDSHWTFVGMENTARYLADYLKPQLPEMAPVPYKRQAANVANITDIAFMLESDPKNPQSMHVQQTVQRVRTPDNKDWKPTPNADVLILGDSFINIYSHGGFWGQGAGFGEQLSYYLQRPIDIIAMDGGGINHTRRMLQRDMEEGHDRLEGKKVVIYEIAARYLSRRDWDTVKLPTKAEIGAKPETQATPLVGSSANVTVRATIKARSMVPDAATTPYPDLVMAVQLSNVQIVGKPKPAKAPQDVVVYLWGMRNSQLTKAAAWKTGQTVTLNLTPWSKVEDEYGSYNRTELEDDAAARLDAYWGVDKG